MEIFRKIKTKFNEFFNIKENGEKDIKYEKIDNDIIETNVKKEKENKENIEDVELEKSNKDELVQLLNFTVCGYILSAEMGICKYKIPPIIGYKCVYYKYKHCDKWLTKKAVLTLEIIPHIHDIMCENDILLNNINNLNPLKKYRCSEVLVVAIQFTGNDDELKNQCLALLDDETHKIVSIHDEKFRYKLEEIAHCGNNNKNRTEIKAGCGTGIHFYLNFEDALNYEGNRQTNFFYKITRKLNKEFLCFCVPNNLYIDKLCIDKRINCNFLDNFKDKNTKLSVLASYSEHLKNKLKYEKEILVQLKGDKFPKYGDKYVELFSSPLIASK